VIWNFKKAHKAALLCLHGFGGDKDSSVIKALMDEMDSEGAGVVTFDWPAHGESTAPDYALTVERCLEDLDAVVKFINQLIKQSNKRICCFATSFGGYLVLKYISEHDNPFQKIALRCPAVDMYDVLTRAIMKDDEYDRVLKGKDVPVGFDRKIIVPCSLLDDLKENDIRERDYLDYADNILIIHGTEDEVVPFEEGRLFAENNLIDFIPVQGADHRFQKPAHMSLANKSVMDFFGL
jgi:alpha-beta hydrolase superfamily lysophospholipase